MPFHIIPDRISNLSEYAAVPMAFWVRSRLVNQDNSLIESPIEVFWKDYDALPGEGPLTWPQKWDLSNWGIFAAFQHGERIGGCAVAYRTSGIDMLAGRDDLAAIWDLRVKPGFQKQGVGHALIEQAITWAASMNCHEIIVETQDNNVAACRLYARCGFVLDLVNPHAYPDLPNEVQLIWKLSLTGAS